MENLNVMEILNQLAIKLGVAVEHLWSVLVKQQYVDGVTCLIVAAFFIVVCIVTACVGPRLHKQWKEKHNELVRDRKENGTGYGGSYGISSFEEDKYRDLSENVLGVTIGICIISAISGVILLICGIRPMLNPDFFAIKDIMTMINGGV